MTDLTWATIRVSLGIGLVLLLALWPTPERATRLLKRWGVADPDPAERAEALRYLKRRRLAYPWLYVASSLLLGQVLNDSGWTAVLVSLIVGAVLAELIAQRPPRGPVRVAPLTSPGVTDLVPRWALGLWAALAVVAIGAPVAVPAADPASPLAAPALAVGLAVAAAAAGIVVVALAVRRPPARIDRADAALRLRSARVGAGLSMAALGVVGADRGSAVGVALLLLGLLGWTWVTARIPVAPADDPARGEAIRPGTAGPPEA